MTAMLVTALKEAGMYDERIKSIGIVTDYSLHPFWEYTAMDYFVAANVAAYSGMYTERYSGK